MKKSRPTATPAQQMLTIARESLPRCSTWHELHNILYGIGGALQRLFPEQSDRVKFAGSPEFQECAKLIRSLGDEPATASDTLPAASGKLLLRLPESLHAALIAEAAEEGVSLNQLILAKLATQLRAAVR